MPVFDLFIIAAKTLIHFVFAALLLRHTLIIHAGGRCPLRSEINFAAVVVFGWLAAGTLMDGDIRFDIADPVFCIAAATVTMSLIFIVLRLRKDHLDHNREYNRSIKPRPAHDL